MFRTYRRRPQTIRAIQLADDTLKEIKGLYDKGTFIFVVHTPTNGLPKALSIEGDGPYPKWAPWGSYFVAHSNGAVSVIGRRHFERDFELAPLP